MITLPPPAITALNQLYVAIEASATAETRQALDLHVPEGDGPFPLIVWIHGGGWHLGDRRIDFAASFNRAGFAVASLGYRLTNQGHPFPAQIEDCLAGLAWLTKNARAHRLDPDRIGLIGHSAGAHLCALLLTCGETGPFNKTTSVRAHAAVLWSPALDLAFGRGRWPATSAVCNPRDPFHLHFFPGGVYDETFALWASPTTYLRTAQPPLLIVHHENDPLVPVGQAREFARLAREAGTEVEFRSDTRTLPDPHNILCPELFAEALGFFRATLARR